MLVQHHAVEADFLAVLPLVQVVVVLVGGHRRVEVGVGKGDAVGSSGAVLHVVLGVVEVGALGKPHNKHGQTLLAAGVGGLAGKLLYGFGLVKQECVGAHGRAPLRRLHHNDGIKP